nr:MAG TPA: hypothetical protein [Caudoviricetes sp.]
MFALKYIIHLAIRHRLHKISNLPNEWKNVAK